MCYHYLSNNYPIPCPYCSGVYHIGNKCPKIKAIEYFRDGRIKKVEFNDESKPPEYIPYIPYIPVKYPFDPNPYPVEPFKYPPHDIKWMPNTLPYNSQSTGYYDPSDIKVTC